MAIRNPAFRNIFQQAYRSTVDAPEPGITSATGPLGRNQDAYMAVYPGAGGVLSDFANPAKKFPYNYDLGGPVEDYEPGDQYLYSNFRGPVESYMNKVFNPPKVEPLNQFLSEVRGGLAETDLTPRPKQLLGALPKQLLDKALGQAPSIELSQSSQPSASLNAPYGSAYQNALMGSLSLDPSKFKQKTDMVANAIPSAAQVISNPSAMNTAQSTNRQSNALVSASEAVRNLMQAGKAIPRGMETGLNLAAYSRVERDSSGNIIGLVGKQKVGAGGTVTGNLAPDWQGQSPSRIDLFKASQLQPGPNTMISDPASIARAQANRQAFLQQRMPEGGVTPYGEKVLPSASSIAQSLLKKEMKASQADVPLPQMQDVKTAVSKEEEIQA